MSTNSEVSVRVLVEESGLDILSFNTPSFPMTEFTLKAKRIQYAAGTPQMVRRLREVIGR